MTTRQTVSGVARIIPTGPQSQPQNNTDTRIATVEMPVREPYSHGSKMFSLRVSNPMNKAAVSSGSDQPSNTASERRIGNDIEISGPITGMKRSGIDSAPQSTALGTPMSVNPSAATM